MKNTLLTKTMTSISKIGATEGDSEELKLQKSLLVICAFPFMFSGAAWGIMHNQLGEKLAGVVAGIIGSKKFAYDIWGDTVNIASRMESSVEAGKVNISASTYDLVKDHFICTYREKIQAKNKGIIDMYFVKSEL